VDGECSPVFVVLWAFTGCSSHPVEKARNDYLDPAACASCHSEIAKEHRQTGIGRSFYRLSPRTSIEDFTSHNTLYHKASDRYYQIEIRDGKYYESRYQNGYGNKETNRVEKQIDFVVGSGNHARSDPCATSEHRLPLGRAEPYPASTRSPRSPPCREPRSFVSVA
jgi:hypothetical protein